MGSLSHSSVRVHRAPSPNSLYADVEDDDSSPRPTRVSSESEEKEKEKGKLINTSSAVVIVVFYHLLHIDCLFSNFVPQMNFLALGKLHFAKSLLTSAAAAAVLSFKIDYLFFQFSQPFPWWRFCHFWKLPFSLSAI